MAAFSPRRRRRGADRSRPLTREKIAAAALEIVRDEGQAALSMRKVAARFDVDVAALYRHLRNKDELLLEVGRLAAEAARLDLPAEGDWEDRVLELCQAIRSCVLQHPELGFYGGGSPWAMPFIARANGRLATLLDEAGLEGEELVYATQALLHVVTSAAQSEVLTRSTARSQNRAFARSVLEALPAPVRASWPRATAENDWSVAFDDFFEFAIRAVLAGVAPDHG